MPHESTMGELNRLEDHQVNDLPSREAGDESIFRTEARVSLDFEALVGLERSESSTPSLQPTVEDTKSEAISGDNDDLGTPDFEGGASTTLRKKREPEPPVPSQGDTDLLAALSALDELNTTNLKLQPSYLDAGANETSSRGRPADGISGFKSSVKVVVWSKGKKASGTSQPLGESGFSGSRNLFIVNQAKRKLDTQQSAVQSHDKVSKKRRKRVEFVTDSPRHSNRIGVKTKKGQVKLSKPEEYKRFIQSYISSRQCVSKTERMKENGDSNLMWLLDFKVDKLFQPPAQESSVPKFSSEFEDIMADLQSDHQCPGDSSMLTSVEPADQQPANAIANISNFDPMNPEHAFTVDLEAVDNVANFEQVESQAMPMPVDTVEESRKIESKSCEPTERLEYTPPEITFDEQGKPRCTYTDLIERALTQSGGLTVSEIYQWISDNYPFFRADDDRWKNSVRHNLSINPYFKKGEKARSGAGHLWTISEESRALKPALRKKDSEYEEINMLIENDTDRAVASILGQYNLAKANMEGKVPPEMPSTSKKTTDEASKEVPTISQENIETLKPTEENTVAPVFLEYDPGNEFSEFTIELNGLNIPDTSSFEFQDLLSGGRLIVIQSEDQDSDKENSMRLGDTSLQNLDEYMANEFSVMQGESHSTETERVSGQLISEALTQDFDSLKNPEKVSNLTETNGYHLSVSHFERLPGGSDSDDFMVLDSMDPVSLQEVIQNSADHGVSDQYHNLLNLSGSPYEPKELGYCEYDHQIAL